MAPAVLKAAGTSLTWSATEASSSTRRTVTLPSPDAEVPPAAATSGASAAAATAAAAERVTVAPRGA